jgi:energy-coupling factor transporter transmembrane protein EcfT
MIDNIGRWFIAHPIIFGLITLVLSCIVSVYSGDIRRFLSIPPQRLSIWLLKARLANAEYKLSQLRDFVGHTYTVVAYVGRSVLFALTYLTLLLSIVFVQLDSRPNAPHFVKSSLQLMFFVILGVLIAVVMVSTVRCHSVITADRSIRRLQDTIRRLDLELVAKDATASGR